MVETHLDDIVGRQGTIVERLALGHVDEKTELEHLARYRWASKHIRGTVLDIACGTGYGAQILQAGGTDFVASVDISFTALSYGKIRHGITAVQSDATAIPFNDAQFDAAVSFETIEHICNVQAFLKELHRVVKPNGVILVSTPNIERSQQINPFHVKEYTIAEVRGLIETHGFRLVSTRGQNWTVDGSGIKRKLIRRVLRASANTYSVVPKIWLAASPLYWCVMAERV